MISRELARERPECVRTVAPWHTGGGRSLLHGCSRHLRRSCVRDSPPLRQRELDRPLQQPLTVIYPADHIVSWPACIDRISPNVTHVEVQSTHVGLGFDPDVWWTVARAHQHHLPPETP